MAGIKSIRETPMGFVIHHESRGVHHVPFTHLDQATRENMSAAARGHAAAVTALASKPDAAGVTHAAAGADVHAGMSAADQQKELDALQAQWNADDAAEAAGQPLPPTGLENLGKVPVASPALASNDEHDIATFPPGTPQSTIDAASAQAGKLDGPVEGAPAPDVFHKDPDLQPGGALDPIYGPTPAGPAPSGATPYPPAPGLLSNAAGTLSEAGSHAAGVLGNLVPQYGLNTGPHGAAAPAAVEAPEPTPALGRFAPPAPAPVSATPAAPATSIPTVAGPKFDFAASDKAQQATEQSLRDQAASAEALAKYRQGIEQRSAKRVADRNAKTIAALAENTKNGQVAADYIKNNPVDPNRLFHEMGIGGGIATFIGSVLGGIGGGLTHSPNEFWTVMDAAIGRDVKAQENARAGQETLLSNYRKQGYDIITSAKLAAATERDYTMGLIQSAVDKFAAPTIGPDGKPVPGSVQATAAGLIAAAQQKNQIERLKALDDAGKIQDYPQQVADHHARNQAAILESNARLGLQSTALKAQDDKNEFIRQQVAGGVDPVDAANKYYLLHDDKERTKHTVAFPKTWVDRAGEEHMALDAKQNPIREIRFARSDDPAKLREAVTAKENMDHVLRRWGDFLDQHPAGTWDPDAVQQFKVIQYPAILEALKQDTNRTALPEIQQLTKAWGDPSSVSGNILFHTAKSAYEEIKKTHYAELHDLEGQLYSR